MPYSRTRRRDKRLGVWDSTAMAVGGMIGGGIFSVLGVAISLAGHLAFACFVIGGIVAALTARSFAGTTARAKGSSGPFELLRSVGHPQVAGVLIWLLVFGYMVAIAVYSFTFGRYAANALRVNDYVLVASGYPRTRAAVEELGFRVLALDMSEFRKLDGGLSCLSLRWQ